MKSVVDHLEIVSATAHKMIYHLVNISSAPNDYVAQARTEAELLRALAKYCSEQADREEYSVTQLQQIQQECQELNRQEQQNPPTDVCGSEGGL